MRISRHCAILVVFGCLYATTCLFGQAVNNAQIHGTVTDPTGAAIIGAQVRATHTLTGLLRTTATGSEGNYSFLNLPVGPYALEVTSAGFQMYNQTGLVLQVSDNVRVDVALKVGTVTQTEDVHADSIMVKTDETRLVYLERRPFATVQNPRGSELDVARRGFQLVEPSESCQPGGD
jgi:hypothetical protein